MKIRYQHLIAALLLSTVLYSCKKKDSITYTPSAEFGYYPTLLGHYVEYDVDSTVWNDFNGDTTFTHYQMRYDVSDTFRDNLNRLSYIVQTKTRSSDSAEWASGAVFYVTPQINALDVITENLRFRKLVFPVTENGAWAGNAQIPALDQDYQYFLGWTYQYQNVGQRYNNGRVQFDNTLTVQERDETIGDPAAQPLNIASRTYAKEIYAYDIGMIYRELVHWTYDPNVSAYIGGYGVVMRATGHN